MAGLVLAQDGDEQCARGRAINDEALRVVRTARGWQRVLTKNAMDFEKIEDLRPFGWQAVSRPAVILDGCLYQCMRTMVNLLSWSWKILKTTGSCWSNGW